MKSSPSLLQLTDTASASLSSTNASSTSPPLNTPQRLVVVLVLVITSIFLLSFDDIFDSQSIVPSRVYDIGNSLNQNSTSDVQAIEPVQQILTVENRPRVEIWQCRFRNDWDTNYHVSSGFDYTYSGSLPFPVPKIWHEGVSNKRVYFKRIRLADSYQIKLYIDRSTDNSTFEGSVWNFDSAYSSIRRFCSRHAMNSSSSSGFNINREFDRKSLEQSNFRAKTITINISSTANFNSNIAAFQINSKDLLSAEESYKLHISKSSGISIVSTSGKGVQHALTTLAQLVFSPVTYNLPLTAIDWPDQYWRGIMIDVARHFQPLALLYRCIDAMEAVKMNTLHLHLTDSQSFPVLLEDRSNLELSKLAKEGSFSPEKMYSLSDLKALVSYAASRGVVVIPEIDVPAHSLSWGKAFADIVVRCEKTANKAQTPTNIYPLDPSNNNTFLIIEEVLTQIVSVFPSPFLHIGGDEVNEHCWQESEHITRWAESNGVSINKITKYFETRVFDIVKRLGKVPIVWQGIVDGENMPDQSTLTRESRGRRLEDIQQDSNQGLYSSLLSTTSLKAIIEPWKCWGGLAVRAAAKAREQGFGVWMAACWYLDFNSDWTTFLSLDLINESKSSSSFVPLSGNVTSSGLQHENYFVGGEGAMWTEMVDHTNFECRMWPRAAAIAYNLWGFVPNACSGYSTSSSNDSIGSGARICSDDEKLEKYSKKRLSTMDLSPSFTRTLYSSFATLKYYLDYQLSVSAAPIVIHFSDSSASSLSGNSLGGSPATAGATFTSAMTSSKYSTKVAYKPYFPRNLTDILQKISMFRAGVSISSQGPRSSESSASNSSSYLQYMWLTAQCFGIPENIQRPLQSSSVSAVQLNIADGSIGQRGDAMLEWLQGKARQGVMLVGFCELNGWQQLQSRTEIVKNVPMLTLRAANAGFAYSHMTKQSAHSSYPVGVVSIFPFQVVQEYYYPYFQRCALHIYVQKLSLHVFIIHLHAHDARQRLQETTFLANIISPLLSRKENVIILGDFNTLSPFDRAQHNLDRLPQILNRTDHTVFSRWRKKYLTADGDAIDYAPMQALLDIGLVDACVEHCCHLTSNSTVACASWDIERTDDFSLCMRKNCAGSEPTKYQPEWSSSYGLAHPLIRLDFILTSPRLKGSSVADAGTEKTNVTDHLSDHYPVYATWAASAFALRRSSIELY